MVISPRTFLCPSHSMSFPRPIPSSLPPPVVEGLKCALFASFGHTMDRVALPYGQQVIILPKCVNLFRTTLGNTAQMKSHQLGDMVSANASGNGTGSQGRSSLDVCHGKRCQALERRSKTHISPIGPVYQQWLKVSFPACRP